MEEHEVADALGPKKTTLKQIRIKEFVRDVDWTYNGLHQVIYTEAGLRKLEERLGVCLPRKPAETPPACPTLPKDAACVLRPSVSDSRHEKNAVALTVVRTNLPNHTTVQTELKDAPGRKYQMVRVRETSKWKYRPGMVFAPGTCERTGSESWNYMGREPRSPGRW